MKKELFITAGLCIIIFFQITMLNGEETWLRTYDPFYESIFGVNNLVICSDGGYAINGTATDTETTWGYGFVIKTDFDGNLLWAEQDTLSYEGLWGNEALTLIETDNGGIISATYPVAGYRTNLIKRDADGNREWVMHLQNMILYTMDRTSDGNVIASGFGPWPVLIKLDQEGNIIWSEMYPFDDYNGGVIKSVIQASDGGYLLAGYLRDNTMLSFYTVMKTDSVGNLLWYNVFDDYQSVTYNYTLIETLNADIIAGGALSGTGGFLWKLDSEGNTIWQEIGYEACERGFWSFAGTSEGMIVSTLNHMVLSHTTIRKFDSDYNVLWTNQLPEGFYGAGDKALRVTQLDFIVVASYIDNKIGLIKLNPEGMDVDDQVIISPERILRAYPNPFNPTVNFSYLLDTPGLVNIEIFNIKGQLIDDLDPGIQPVGRHHLQWQAKNLGSGVYFVILKLNNEIIDTQKIMLLK